MLSKFYKSFVEVLFFYVYLFQGVLSLRDNVTPVKKEKNINLHLTARYNFMYT